MAAMKNQLPLLLLLSASTFGLGHELGANGPRDNPDTPWGPGDTIQKTFAWTKSSGWFEENREASWSDYYDACDEDPTLLDKARIEEEVGDWVRLPDFGWGLAHLLEQEDCWLYLPHVLEASGEGSKAKPIQIDCVVIH